MSVRAAGLRRDVLGYLVIGLFGLASLCAVTVKYSQDRKAALQHFRESSHQVASAAESRVESQFTQIYQNLRTISFLPSVRKISRHGETLDADGRQSIQALYNNLASNVAVSEVYVVPADLDPEAIDPVTGQKQAPILMFDELITGRSTAGGEEAEAAADADKPEEVEIYEYRLLAEQMRWFGQRTPNLAGTDGIHLPMIGSPALITCDNSEYDTTRLDADRMGIVLSVPFFGEDGAFKGTISAIIRTKALASMLPSADYTLVNQAYNLAIVGGKPGSPLNKMAAAGRPDPALDYSEALPLTTAEAEGVWRLWVGLPNSAFEKSPEARSARLSGLAAGAFVLLLMAFAAAAVWFLDRNSRLIDGASRALDALADGDHNRELQGAERSDAIGNLARAFAKFRRSLQENLRLETLAEQERRAAEDLRQSREEDERAAAQAQERIVASLAQALSALSQGDLSMRITDRFPGGYDRLREDFNAAAEQLDGVLTLVRRNTDGILDRVAQIARAYELLSQRTTAQAANVQETSATLVGIADAVKSSAKATAQASEAVRSAQAEAEQSEEVISSTVGAMDDIVESTQKISQIVEVIDGIAFQTNLLALNAGVEAARAGDAGRGFAVVAQEVRALAQHTAERAKDINELVFTSKEQVSGGMTYVTNTGDTLRRIVGQVRELADFVGAIAEATQEQAGRLGAVNVAANHLEAATQENARMAEECTEAVNVLHRQADELHEVVARFQLTQGQEPVERAVLPEEDSSGGLAKVAHQGHVLIVDDNEVNRTVAATMCRMFGFSCDFATDGPGAIRAARGGRYDLILMDIMMPDMNGNEATREIRRLAGAAGRVPIIAVTANTLESSLQENRAAGITCVVEKPISPDGLYRAMQSALGQRQERAA